MTYKVISSSVLNYGGVESISVGNPGGGYDETTTVTISGDGTGATADVVLGSIADQVGSFTITNAGSGYTSAPAVSTNGGVDLVATAVLSTAGSVKSVTVDVPGTGYTVAPTVAFTGGGGTGAAGTAVLSGDGVASVTITNAGSGYTSTPTVEFTGDGIDAAGTAVRGFTIASITVDVAGYGYIPNLPAIFTGGDGTGAAAHINVIDGTLGDNVASVIITNKGTGYSYATAVIDGPGENATCEVFLDTLVDKVRNEIGEGTLYGGVSVDTVRGKTQYTQALNFVQPG